jgi:hypothetical protein
MHRLQEGISAKPWEPRETVVKEGLWLDAIPFERPQLIVQTNAKKWKALACDNRETFLEATFIFWSFSSKRILYDPMENLA